MQSRRPSAMPESTPSAKRRRRLLCAVAVALMLAAHATSAVARQQKTAPAKAGSQDQPVRLKADLVELRAVVTDKQGKPVANLSKDDFEVAENGRKQVVSFFSAEDLRAEPRPAPSKTPTSKTPEDRPALPSRSTTREAPPRRTVVFLVDTLHMTNTSLLRVRQELRKFIDERLGDDDFAAVVTPTGGLGIFSQFTYDKQVLHMAIRRLAISPESFAGSFYTPYLAARVQQENTAEEPPGRSLATKMASLPPALQTAMNIVKAEENLPDAYGIIYTRTVSKGREILVEVSQRRRQTLLTLKAVAEALATKPGQRLVFLFSDGFTMYDDLGAAESDDLQAAISRATRAGSVVYTIAAKGLTGPSLYEAAGSGRASPDLPGMNNIPSFSLAGDRELEHGMQRLAAGTGGDAYLTTNDLTGAMDQALDANRLYYALGYYPANADKSDGFRSIKVKVRGHPEYAVRTQSGYLASELFKEQPVAPADPLKELIKFMGEPLPKTGLHVEATADFLYLSADQAQVSLNVFIDAGKLGYKEQENGLLTSPTMLTGILNSAGNTMGVLQDTIQIRLSREQLERARGSMYRYTKRIVLKPGVYQVRIGVHDPQTEQVGTTSVWVEVPDLKSKKLILSSIQTARAQADETGEGTGEALAQPDVRNGISVFRRDDVITYRGWAYKPTVGEDSAGITIRGQVLQDDRVVLEDEWRPLSSFILKKEANAVEFGSRLKAAGFKPGLYTLRVLVKEPQSKTELMKETLFEVVP